MLSSLRARAAASLAALLVAGTALAGCSADPEPATLDLDRSPSASPSTSPEESDEDGAEGAGSLATSYPDVGLEFTSLPDASGPRREALETYVAYERGLRQLSRTAEPNELITDNAGPALIDVMNSTIDFLRGDDVRYDGTAQVAVSFDGFSRRAAVLDLCTDGSDLQLVTGGTPGPIQGSPRAAGRVVLTNTEQSWIVTQYETLDQTC